MEVNKTKFDSGLTLLTIPQKERSTATVLVLVGAGSKYETKEINGISHILEHLIFKGTSKRPTPQDIAAELDRVGGAYNAFTGQEYTGYYARVDSQHFSLAADWVSDIFLNAALRDEDLQREKPVIMEELNMYLDSPQQYVSELWSEVLYGDQPAGWKIIGSRETIESISIDQVQNYFQEYYTAPKTVVVVAGNIPDRAEEIINNKFKSLQRNERPSKEKTKVKQDKPQLLVHYKETDQTHLCVGGHGFSLKDDQRFAQIILASALGGNMSSRLFNIIREKNSLAYYVHTSSSSSTDSGSLVTQAGVTNSKVKKALRLILEEYQKIAQNGLEAEELQKVKEYLKGSLRLKLEAAHQLAFHFGKEQLLTSQTLTIDELIKKITTVTNKEVKKVAQQIFQNKNLNLALIGPFNKEDLQSQLTFK